MFYSEDFQKKATIENGFAQCSLRKYLKNISAVFVCISWYMFSKVLSHYAVCKETFIVNLLKMFYLFFSQFLKYALISVWSHCSHLTRGTQRLSICSEKQILPRIFYSLRTAKNLYLTVPFMYNFRSLSNKFTTIFWRLIFQILLPRLGYFSQEKETKN